MNPPTPRKRLDEILLSEGLITESQIRDALLRQKAHGGKFGSQLLYHRYIDEAGLVRALEIQFGCKGVVLSKIEIPEVLCKMIPRKIAASRKVMPFDYDTEKNILKIACEDPTDQHLINEISFVARGKKVEFYIAAEIALDTAIARYYQGREISLDDNLLLEIPDTATDTGRIRVNTSGNVSVTAEKIQPKVLVVTNSVYSVPHLQSLMERDDYHVDVVDSIEKALGYIGEKKFDAILINDPRPENHVDLVNRVRKFSPETVIRFYQTASDLFVENGLPAGLDESLSRTLDLLTALIASKSGQAVNHSGRVGEYAQKLCSRLKISPYDRLLVTTAAYIHDLSRFYYRMEEKEDNRHIIQLTIRLLSSLNYQPEIMDILKAMYTDTAGKNTQSLPLAALGGSILTIVDLFCDSIPTEDRLSLEKFDAIKRRLRDLSGRLFLPEVVETFIGMIQEEILDSGTAQNTGQIMIYSTDLSHRQGLELRLRNEGFRTISQGTPEEVAELYQRREPDLIILIIPGDHAQVRSRVNDLAAWGVNLTRMPAFLLADAGEVAHLTDLMEQGLEDILALDDNLDLLVTKIRKMQAKLTAQQKKAGIEAGAGARGRLADMNLIDLLQALGPGLKTVRIMVLAGPPISDTLNIFLNKGEIIHAACRDKDGAEAVYEGLTWVDGTWTVEPIAPEVLPRPNNKASNESILMEGCRRLDEKIKSGHLL